MKVDIDKIRAEASRYCDYPQLKIKVQNVFIGWHLDDSATIFAKSREMLGVLEEVIDLVERFSNDISKLTGQEKQDAVVSFLDDCIEVPFYLEWADGIALRLLISQVVDLKNKYFGGPELKHE